MDRSRCGDGAGSDGPIAAKLHGVPGSFSELLPVSVQRAGLGGTAWDVVLLKRPKT